LISSAGPATAADSSVTSAANAQGGGVTLNATLPEAIRVDETKYKIVATLRGIGKQVYDCPAGATTYTFREPIAGLFTPRGLPDGIHGAGPFWANFDGSRFVGTGTVTSGGGSTPAPKPTADIPWLRVAKVSTAGTGGAFSNVALQLWAGTVGFLADNRRVCRVQCNRTRRR
jgi:hypothetical protein